MFNDKTLMVTGGTGSFGKQFIRTVLKRFSARKIIVFSRDELKQAEMQNDPDFSESRGVRFFIGDIRDRERLALAMRNGVDHIVHTAALKHVPLLEYNPFEAIKTNILGSQNVIEEAIKAGVTSVVALSTDKASSPTNLYGATKLAADKLFVSANNVAGGKPRFSIVRYGNVFGSRGSVIPRFFNEKKNGSFPITDIRMTRFGVTLQQGVDFVIKCFERTLGGELFVPKLPSFRIVDLAEAIDADMPHRIIGMRPGEKLHEELISENDWSNTLEFEHYFLILSQSLYNPHNEDDYAKANSEPPIKMVGGATSYNSKTNEIFLSISEIRNLIAEHIESTNW
jgi:UDP-N-acetylglucosamine 4,6-dehydratase/5-epimerase